MERSNIRKYNGSLRKGQIIQEVISGIGKTPSGEAHTPTPTAHHPKGTRSHHLQPHIIGELKTSVGQPLTREKKRENTDSRDLDGLTISNLSSRKHTSTQEQRRTYLARKQQKGTIQ